MENKTRMLLTGLCAVGAVCGARAAEAKKPNVLLIVADDHGREAMGCYGNPVVKTPAMDALARDGIRFENAFCTSASSSASRAVILTGKFGHSIAHYGHSHSYHHFSTYATEKSLPIYLSQAGYSTTRIGKYHVEPESVYRFDREIPADARSSVRMADDCAGVIAGGSEKPFFLYYCTDDPHRNEVFLDGVPYRPNAFGNRAGGYEGVTEVTYRPEDVIVPSFLPDTPECRAELAQYYQSISRVDQGVARLVELLKKNNQYDNTLIIYISDNGAAFPGAKTTLYEPGMRLPCIVKLPGSQNAGTVCESFVSWVDLTPTILDFTGAGAAKDMAGRSFAAELRKPAGKVCEKIYAAHTFHEVTMYYPMRVVRQGNYKLIYNLAWWMPYPFASDLWSSPTWRSIAVRATPEEKRAAALSPVISGTTSMYVDRQGVPLVFEDVMASDLVFGKRTLHDYIVRPKFELYDLAADPDEVKNLAADPAHADVLKRLCDDLKEFQSRTKDPWISKWEYE